MIGLSRPWETYYGLGGSWRLQSYLWEEYFIATVRSLRITGFSVGSQRTYARVRDSSRCH
jgi:hypothetical protein